MNILVVSDNQHLFKSFREIILQHNFMNHSFNFCSTSETVSTKEAIPLINIPGEYREKILGKYELVFSVHCRQLFPAELVKAVRCINVHPGFTPFNNGWYPHVFSIINKQPAGATIHEMDEKLDNGPVIAQKEVNIYAWETSLDVYNKVISAELDLLREHLESIITSKYKTTVKEVAGTFHSINEFRKLCELNREEKMTLGNAIDLLRALTHPPYSNAFFIDKTTKKKVYVDLKLKMTNHE